MRTVIQRVQHASVAIDGAVRSEIGKGLLILVGFEDSDTDKEIVRMAKKIVNMKIFDVGSLTYILFENFVISI